MIQSLHIENIAVVKRLDVDLGEGFTVLSGETGAGKSIIIDSLGLLLGGRADKELIRTGEERAEVSAVFADIPEAARREIESLGFEAEDGCVMISRSIGASSSAARINGRAVTLSVLRQIARTLFNIHGQNDNAQLLDPKNHLAMLDAYAKTEKEAADYYEIYKKITAIRAQISEIRRDEQEQLRLCEMLRFQIADIDAVKPKRGEEEALSELAKKLRSAEQISRCCSAADRALQGGERGKGAIYLADRAAAAMEAIADAIPEAGALALRLRDIRYELEDIAESVSSLDDVGADDVLSRLDKTEARLDAISKLQRKYGSTVDEVLAYRADAAERLERIENSSDRIAELEDELRIAEARAKELSDVLTQKRRRAAKGLRTGVTDTLAFLDMPKVSFEVSVSQSKDFLPSGRDEVEFMISTNPGEPLMPMAKIASGGELARIMLSLKNVLNVCDGVDTVIFDEIDTGISGKTSRKVGIKLKEIGNGAQVICITHSAQIASLAHAHLYISKREVDGRAETELAYLDESGRVEEIARILGGIDITEAQRRAAREMIEEGRSY